MQNIDGETQSPQEPEEDKTSKNGNEGANVEEGKEQEADAKTLLAQKVHYREKAKKLEDEKAALEAKVQELQAQTQSPVKDKEDKTNEPADTNSWKEKVDFLLANRDYSKEEVEFLSAIAKGTGKPLKSLTEDKDIKEFLTLKRKRVEDEKRSLNPSSRADDSSLHEEIAKIPEKDMAKRYPEILQQIMARKRSQKTV